MSSSTGVRSEYHHGDLRNALIAAAAELARGGGPDSVTIRAAARAAGVTPTAAYRHFAGQEKLLEAAQHEALARLLSAMNDELRALPDKDAAVARALGRLAAIGRGYIRFATAEGGLFRTAFSCEGLPMPPEEPAGPEHEPNPFHTLVTVMDELVEVGYLPIERRPMAEFAAWSSVHGIAMLFLDGPMRHADEQLRTEALNRTMLIFVEGLAGTALTEELRTVITG